MALSSVEKKKAKLTKTTVIESEQLIFPQDLNSDFDKNLGHCVLFEPNIIEGGTVTYKNGLSPAVNRIDGISSEVAMQNASLNGGSMRGGKLMGNLYKKSNERIVLPMPQTITTNYVATWQTTDLGAVGRTADFVDSLVNWNGTARDQATTAAVRSLAKAAQSVTGLAVADALELKTGTMLNPYIETLFKGMSARMIPFSYTLTPRNEKEAETIRAIINRFKFHMMPEFKYQEDNNSFLLHPSTFDISYLDLTTGQANPWQSRIMTCALSNVSINGTPNGEYATLVNGAPQSVTIDLFFSELTLLTKENFTESGYSY